jgi:hypothetical protein
MFVRREGPRVSIVEKDGRTMWSGRTDTLPPEYIEFREDGVNYAWPVAKATDAQLIHAVKQREQISK